MSNVKAIPEGYTTVTPYLVIKGCADAIEFYKKAFGAEERFRMKGPGGTVAHAEIRIGNAIVMMSEEFPGTEGSGSPTTLGGSTFNAHLYVDDADAVFKQAVAAGAKVSQPMEDAFWGDRYGKVTDPFGHVWGIATHMEDVAPDEMDRRAKEVFAKMGQGE